MGALHERTITTKTQKPADSAPHRRHPARPDSARSEGPLHLTTMGQSSLNFHADEDDQDEEPGATALPADAQDRDSSSLGSPNFQLAAASNPEDDAARSADATRTNAASGDDASSNEQPSDAVSGSGVTNPASDMLQVSQQQPVSPAPQQQPSDTTADNSDSLAQPTASGAAPAPRQRQPVKQIGQIPLIDDAWMYQPPAAQSAETPAQAQERHTAWMRMAQQSQAQQQQIAQINQSNPYLSGDDGRWKKQTADPSTGAVHEMDILDAGTGKIDRSTGDIYVQTAQGPQLIGTDPRQKLLAPDGFSAFLAH